MPKKSGQYSPGYEYRVLIDGEEYFTMGFTASARVDSNDLTVNSNGGWGDKEPGVRDVTMTFSIPVKKDGSSAPVEEGDIWEMTFLVNNAMKYNGDWLITACNLNSPIRGTKTYEITAESKGDVKKPYTPPSP